MIDRLIGIKPGLTENGEFALIDESAASGISGFEPPYLIDFNSRRGRLGGLD